MILVGYELASVDLPFVPDFVILREKDPRIDGPPFVPDSTVRIVDGLRLKMRTAVEPLPWPALEQLVEDGKVRTLGPSEMEDWRDGSWPAVEAGGLRWFFLSDEKRWREARARSLLQEAQEVKGDPARKLVLLSASGNMGRVNVPELVSSLEARRRSPSESLLDIYRRLEEDPVTR
jgi:hypothetical protein